MGRPPSESEIRFLDTVEDGNLDLLIDRRYININVKGKEGKTALCKAIDKGYTDIVEWLLTLGADANIGYYEVS